MGEHPRVSPARPLPDAGWSERDLLLATTQLLRNLCAWTVVSGRIPGDSMRDIVEISALQLEEDGASPAAVTALRTVFEGAVNGDWERLHRLVDGHKSNGKPPRRAPTKPQRRAPITQDDHGEATANVYCIKKR